MLILPKAIPSLDKSETSGTTWEELKCTSPHGVWLHWLMIQTSKGKKIKQPFRVVTKHRPYLILGYGPSEMAAFRQVRFLSELFQDMPTAPDAPTIHRMLDQALRDLKLMRKQRKKDKNKLPNSRQAAALAVAQSIAAASSASSSRAAPSSPSSPAPSSPGPQDETEDDEDLLSFSVMLRFRATQTGSSPSAAPESSASPSSTSSAASSSSPTAVASTGPEFETSEDSSWSIPSSALFD